MKRGARVVINDHCLTPVGTENAWDEARIRSMDLGMLAILNAHERDAEQFCELFKAADEKFVFKVCTNLTFIQCTFLYVAQLLTDLGRYQNRGMQNGGFRGCMGAVATLQQ